ncbi:hypothetical protein [Spiroplasma endosymbiont of Tiphia femorata]|uniref:hypothetical protein n=1 Tax=Spiroplasma endosymbiont of Tiphia femorata TaxID=3066326 RepID=UPI0030CF611B
MPAGLTALLNMIGGIGQQLLSSFSYVFNWVFAGDSIMTNWPVLIPIFMMVLVFIKEFIGHIIRGFR